MEQVLFHLDSDISWIGTGTQTVCSGLAQAKAVLEAEKRTYSGRFTVTDSRLTCTPLSPDCCLVSGEIAARPEERACTPLRARGTAVFRRTGEEMRLVHIHLSYTDRDTSGAVQRPAIGDWSALRALVAQTNRTLEERNQELETLLENVPGGMHQCRNDACLSLVNMSRSFLAICGYSREEIRDELGDQYLNIIYPEDRAAVRRELLEQTVAGSMVELEYRIRRKDGDTMWVLDKGRLAVGPDGDTTYYCMLVDVTARKKMEEELRLSLERHQIIMDQATEIIFEWDIGRDTLSCSSNWRKKFGYDPIRAAVTADLPRSRNLHHEDISAVLRIMEQVKAGVLYSETKFRIRDVLGRYIWCRIRATGQCDSAGKPIRAVGVIIDIDAEQRHEQKLIDQATKDGLTGLLNRNAVKAQAEARLAAGVGEHALMIVDLDGFKGINDRCGHLCGDAALMDTAAALRRVFKDSGLLGRIGGDEFLIFLPQVKDRNDVAQKAAELLAAVKGITVAEGLTLSCSIGMAMTAADGQDYLSLYRHADRALYQVKKAGRGAYAFCNGTCLGDLSMDLDLSAVSRTIDSDLGDPDQTLTQFAFHMLYAATDIRDAIHQLLEVVGRTYDVSRVYIFEDEKDGLTCSNTFEWCGEGVKPEINSLQRIPYSEGYRELFNEDGIFYCRDIQRLSPEAYAVMAPQNIASVLQCAILEDGKMTGFVGFDECRHNRYWNEQQVRSLSLVAKVLSAFLTKERLKERLDRLEKRN